MANYQSQSRSNYFPFLKPQLDLIEELFGLDIQLSFKNNMVAIISRCPFTPSVFDPPIELLEELGVPNADNVDDVSLLDVIHHALPPDTSLVWVEVGHEKARYLIGQALRIDHTGQITQSIDLNNIYLEGESRAEY